LGGSAGGDGGSGGAAGGAGGRGGAEGGTSGKFKHERQSVESGPLQRPHEEWHGMHVGARPLRSM
jgi:hypothetical protein